MKRFLARLIIVILFSTKVYSNSLSPLEKQISDYITKQQTAELASLKTLVNINSGTNHPAGVKRVGKILAAEFRKLGFHTHWVDEPPYMHRGPTLVAERKGRKGKRLLLIGHLDTVFSKDSAFQVFKRQGDFATGPGVVDDKGGDVVILYALKALAAHHALDDATIRIVLTGDEEDSGKPASISRRPLFAAAKQSDVALDFECANTAHTASIGRRGISNWRLVTKGKEAHSSEIFKAGVGDGAIFEMARLLDTLRQQLSKQKDLSFNPGLIIGGTEIKEDRLKHRGQTMGKENVIAKIAIAQGDLRYLSKEQKEAAKKDMVKIVETHHLPGTKASIRFEDGIPAMPATDANQALLEQYSRASTDLGYGAISALDAGARGAGDISYIAEQVAQNLVGLGPLGTGLHSSEETLNISSLNMQTQRAALLIYRLMH
jgi:glutamate carboxypeptidase